MRKDRKQIPMPVTDVKIISKTFKINYNNLVPGMSGKIQRVSKEIEVIKN